MLKNMAKVDRALPIFFPPSGQVPVFMITLL